MSEINLENALKTLNFIIQKKDMLAVVRIRGTPDLRGEIRDTLKMLRLNSINSCVLVPEAKELRGMVDKIKDLATFGEIENNILVEMLKKRLRLVSGKAVDEKTLKEATGFNSYDELANMMMEGNVKLSSFKNLQPIFRLSPPSKGFKSAKEHYPKGDLGYRGKEINDLLSKMI